MGWIFQNGDKTPGYLWGSLPPRWIWGMFQDHSAYVQRRRALGVYEHPLCWDHSLFSGRWIQLLVSETQGKDTCWVRPWMIDMRNLSPCRHVWFDTVFPTSMCFLEQKKILETKLGTAWRCERYPRIKTGIAIHQWTAIPVFIPG